MIIVRIIINALPEKRKEVMQTLLSINKLPDNRSEYLSCCVFCDMDNENIFNLISEWKTRRHLESYIRSERFSVLLGTTTLLCEPLKINILTVSGAEGIETVRAIREKRADFPR